MAIEKAFYLNYVEAVKFHVIYMRKVGETRFGVFDKHLVESALMRPQNAAIYENADIIKRCGDFVFRFDKKPSLERRKQTHRNVFDKLVFKEKQLEAGLSDGRDNQNGFECRIGRLES